jgi:hypothetical protein
MVRFCKKKPTDGETSAQHRRRSKGVAFLPRIEQSILNPACASQSAHRKMTNL